MKPYLPVSLDQLYREMAARKARKERLARAGCYLLFPLLCLILHWVW